MPARRQTHAEPRHGVQQHRCHGRCGAGRSACPQPEARHPQRGLQRHHRRRSHGNGEPDCAGDATGLDRTAWQWDHGTGRGRPRAGARHGRLPHGAGRGREPARCRGSIGAGRCPSRLQAQGPEHLQQRHPGRRSLRHCGGDRGCRVVAPAGPLPQRHRQRGHRSHCQCPCVSRLRPGRTASVQQSYHGGRGTLARRGSGNKPQFEGALPRQQWHRTRRCPCHRCCSPSEPVPQELVPARQ
mmetsp:Transcript_64733/g.183704  ORF Transcript_64733/g.183704 Transcript_64733/m.183704 type:complete len:241 (-) Transcript_64733:1078-1800(-)